MKQAKRILPWLIILLLTFPAMAENLPDLLGTWKGVSRGVMRVDKDQEGNGPLRHHEAGFFRTDVTFVVERQEGHSFSGVFRSSHGEEAIVGVIHTDGIHLSAVDDDGMLQGTLTGRHTLQFIYTRPGKDFKVATIVEYVRQ